MFEAVQQVAESLNLEELKKEASESLREIEQVKLGIVEARLGRLTMAQDVDEPGPAWETHGTEDGCSLPLSPVVVVRDHQHCIPLSSILTDHGIIALLTPDLLGSTDPFEPLPRALVARHDKVQVRHMTYGRYGVTEHYTQFIKEAEVVIFFMTHPPTEAGGNQVALGEVARHTSNHPFIVVSCFDVQPYYPQGVFPTIVQVPGYAPSDLEAVAIIIFGERLAEG